MISTKLTVHKQISSFWTQKYYKSNKIFLIMFHEIMHQDLPVGAGSVGSIVSFFVFSRGS